MKRHSVSLSRDNVECRLGDSRRVIGNTATGHNLTYPCSPKQPGEKKKEYLHRVIKNNSDLDSCLLSSLYVKTQKKCEKLLLSVSWQNSIYSFSFLLESVIRNSANVLINCKQCITALCLRKEGKTDKPLLGYCHWAFSL